MIEARVPWTLEGPDDAITFNDGVSPWTLTEKPRTAVDDRREVYDYPLDDGGFVGDAYAGTRMWALKGMLVAESHTERNTELQRMQALLNSLRRADGLLKWTPTGFPAVQSAVRRMGSLDYSGGANKHVPFAFSLLSGDPRVYSQVENTASVAASTESLGAEMLPATDTNLEASIGTWRAFGSSHTVTRSTTFAHAGTASMRIQKNSDSDANERTTDRDTAVIIPVTPGVLYEFSAFVRRQVAGTIRMPIVFNAGAGVSQPTEAIPAGVFTKITAREVAPPGATLVQVQFATSDSGMLTNPIYVDTISLKPVNQSASAAIVNAGDAITPPVYVVRGAASNPKILASGSGDAMTIATTIASNAEVTIDARAREVYSGSLLTSASNLYATKPSTDPFPLLVPGAQNVSMTAGGTDLNTLLRVLWRDAWMP